MPIILPVTLCTAAAAAILALWLTVRVGVVRRARGIALGDGGDEQLQRRMRAEANYVENTPIVLILIAAIELTGQAGPWLAWVAALYMLARVIHPLGMEGGAMRWGRMVGAIVTMLTLLGLPAMVALMLFGLA